MQTEKVGPERWLGPLLEERAVVRDEPLSPLPPNFAQNSPDLGVWTTRVALLIIRLAKAPDFHICGGSHFGFASRGGSAMVKNPVSPPPKVWGETLLKNSPDLAQNSPDLGLGTMRVVLLNLQAFVCGCAGIWKGWAGGLFFFGAF